VGLVTDIISIIILLNSTKEYHKDITLYGNLN